MYVRDPLLTYVDETEISYTRLYVLAHKIKTAVSYEESEPFLESQ